MPQVSSFNTWEKFFRKNKAAQASNFFITSIIGKVSDGSPYKTAHETYAKEPGVFLMNYCPVPDEIHLYHTLDVLGGSIQQPKTFLVALHGLDCEAFPIVISESSIQGVNVKTPNWDDFKEVAGNERSFTSLKENNQDYLLNNFLPVPVLLMEAYLTSSDKNPASIGLAFIDAFHTYDEYIDEDIADEDDDEEAVIVPRAKDKFSENYLCAIQYCWLASNNKLRGKALTVAYSQNEMIKRWSKEKHSIAIAPVSAIIPGSLTSSTRDIALISALTEMKESMESTRKSTTKISEETERGFDKLDESLKNLFIKASATKPYHAVPTSPSKFTSEFYLCKTVGRAKICLDNHLLKKKVQWTVNQPLVSALYTGNVNWDRLEFPSNLSIFFCADAPLGASSSYQSKALSLVDKIDHSDIAKLIKQKIMLPAGVFEAIMMLKNYLSLTELLFNENSRLPLMIESWVEHILGNMRVYQFAHDADTNFMSSVIFRIDKAASIFIRSCQEAEETSDINTIVLDMHNVQNSIVEQHFHQKLPTGLIPAPLINKDYEPNKRFKGGKDEEVGGGPPAGGKGKQKGKTPKRGKEDDDSPKVENKNKSFLMEKGESFSELFYKNKHLAPQEKGVNVCLSFWIHGYCNEGCPRAHSKISVATETAFAEFMANCRGGTPPKLKKGEQDFAHRAEEEDEE